MSTVNQPLYPPLRLDLENERVWCGEKLVKLTPKAFLVLRYLMGHPRRLVSREELLRGVWSGVVVSEWALSTCIREIRKELGDKAQEPHYIETIHRRGYRFIAPLTTTPPVQGLESRVQGPESGVRNSQSPIRIPQSTIGLVGREAELGQLQNLLEKALAGQRQVVFVTGEAGIGKTTMVEAFVQQAGAQGGVWIGRGQCVEHYGAGEAYLPVLEALGRLCREPGRESLKGLLRHYAPTWLMQMPWLIEASEREGLQRETVGATRERMLREIAEALEELTAKTGLVVVLEDLQWSDYSTLDLISSLARRRERARLMVIGTYRPVEVILRNHPLKGVKQELQLHRQSEELALGGLTEAGVREYLAVRFAAGAHGRAPLQELAQVIHQRTDGNPLFMVNVVDYVVVRGLVVEVEGWWELKGQLEEVKEGVPESLREMIGRQVEGLSPEEQRVLEAGSVAGVEFSAAAVAAALEEEVFHIEERCQGLVRRGQFLQSSGTSEWPDETVVGRYSFIHALYQNVLYERVGVARRLHLHQRIGEREEAAYGGRAREIAAELAMHFERGRDYRRAVQYLWQAGGNALQRSANQEAIDHLTKGLELLKTQPDTPERTQQELLLQTTLGLALMATRGYAAPEVEKAYARARELCQKVGETPGLFLVLHGLCQFYNVRAELQTARELAEQLLRLAQRQQDPALLLAAHTALGLILFWLGEVASARAQLEQSIAIYDSQQHRSLAFLYGQDFGMTCLAVGALNLWFLGYSDQALKRLQDALTLARELSHPFSLAYALILASWLHQLRREGPAVQEQAEEVIALSTEQGFPLWVGVGTVLRGWALVEQGEKEEGIAQIRQGEAAYRATGAEVARTHHLALLGEAHGKAGQAGEGLTVLAEALAVVHKNGERFYEAELYRLKGELLLKSKVQGPKSKVSKEAEECFRQAIAIARGQSAKSLELRAVMSLSRLWQKQGKREEARKMLEEIYSWFTEGLDTADLKEAKALLENLAGR